jgi:hypothetical protein
MIIFFLKIVKTERGGTWLDLLSHSFGGRREATSAQKFDQTVSVWSLPGRDVMKRICSLTGSNDPGVAH